MARGFSGQQLKVLRILEQCERFGLQMPTRRELARTLKLTPSGVNTHLWRLETIGAIVIDGKPRGITVV